MTAGLIIDIETKGENRVVVRIGGRLDANSAPVLERKLDELIEGGKSYLILDFSKVDYLSSAGIRLLLSTTKRLSEGGSLKVCAINEEVMEIIKMAGFEKILNIYSNEQEALK